MDSKLVEEWVEVARHDMGTVELILANRGHPDIAIYHMHQKFFEVLVRVPGIPACMRKIKYTTGDPGGSI
ncbi:MAG: hypothetical protein ABIJ86_09360 [Spirochaetota bacterium]